MYAVANPSINNADLAKIRSSRCTVDNEIARVDASGLRYRELNRILRDLVASGVKRIELYNVQGQRYIGTSLGGNIEIVISGTPGNDLGAFMDGPKIHVCGNAQDGCGNTMNSGEIVVNGSVGDIPGYAMRGGRLFIKENVGYRAGIHMKEYGSQIPAMVVGGTPGDFLAEYMAGGIIVLLGLNLEHDKIHRLSHVGTGMHGGRIYVRGEISGLGKEAVVKEITDQDISMLQPLIEDFSRHFDYDPRKIIDSEFLKITPNSDRPYEKLYAY
jgi:glutamate synthase domain-containing protein 3